MTIEIDGQYWVRDLLYLCVTSDHYIGINVSGKYGWIRVNTEDRENPLILEYALEQ